MLFRFLSSVLLFLFFFACTPKGSGRKITSSMQQGSSVGSVTSNSSQAFQSPTFLINKVTDAYGNETPYVTIHQNTLLGLSVPHYIKVTACPSDIFYCQTGIKVASDASSNMPGAQTLTEVPGLSPGNWSISTQACVDIENGDKLESSCGVANTMSYTQGTFTNTVPYLKKKEKETFPGFETVAHALALAVRDYQEASNDCEDEAYKDLKALPDTFLNTYLGYTPFERAKALSTSSLQLLVTTTDEGKRQLSLIMSEKIYDFIFLKELAEVVNSVSEDGEISDEEKEEETIEATIESIAAAIGLGTSTAGFDSARKDLQKALEAEKELPLAQEKFLKKTEAIFTDVKINGKNINTGDKPDFSQAQVKSLVNASLAGEEQFQSFMKVNHSMEEAEIKKLWSNLEKLKVEVASSSEFKSIKTKEDLNKLLKGDIGIKNNDRISKSIKTLYDMLPLQKAKGALGEIQYSKALGGLKAGGSAAVLIASVVGGGAGVHESVNEITGEESSTFQLSGGEACKKLVESLEDILDAGEESGKLQNELRALQAQLP